MHLAEAVGGEYLLQVGKTCFQVLQVHLLALCYQWIDHIHLSAFAHLLAYALIEANHLVFILMQGHDGFSAWRQFVYHTHVEVAIDGHGEGARNWCGCHHEYVGWIVVFAPQLCPLSHSKTVLLVYHGKS